MNELFMRRAESSAQTGREPAYLGGQPRLERSVSWPVCSLCHRPQTFFLQVDFPSGHPWEGKSLAIFACVRCAHEDYLIPEMLPGPLSGARVSLDFTYNSQRNFRFLLLAARGGVLRKEVEAAVAFRPVHLDLHLGPDNIGHVGGAPRWILEDESPAPPFVFLMQVDDGLVFETTETAPRALTLALNGMPKPSEKAGYDLFLGNALYVFGAEVEGASYVYALTQTE